MNGKLLVGIPRVRLNFCKTVRSSARGMLEWRSGHNRSISGDLLLEDAGICISEALRGRVGGGSVNGIAVRGWRGASAACLRYPEDVTGCALGDSIRVLGPCPPVPLMVLRSKASNRTHLPQRMIRQMSHRNFAQERKNRPRGSRSKRYK